MSYRTDCRYFTGYKPCRFKRPCSGCPEYTPVGKRIALVSLEALGAVMRSTCLLPPLKRKYPNSHITWITLPSAKPLLEHNEYIDRLITLDAKNHSLIQYLQFDVLCAVDKSTESGALAEMIHANEKYGFGLDPSGVIRPFTRHAHYLYDVGLDDHLKFHKNQKPETQMITESMGLDWKRDPYVLNFSAEEKNRIEILYRQLRVRAKAVIGYNTGCSTLYPYKKLTVEKSIDMIAQWRKNFPNTAVALLGGREDSERQHLMKLAFESDPNVINTPTNEGLRSGMHWMSACDIVFSGCSLGLHLGVALKKYVIAWFGVSCPQEIDLYDRGEKLLAEVGCSPCWKKSCTNEPKCFDQVNPNHIIDATNKGFSFLKLLAVLLALFPAVSNAQSKKDQPMNNEGHVNFDLVHANSEELGHKAHKKNMSNQVIYQIVVDRFFNGSATKDQLYDGVYQAKNWPSEPYLHFGGDIKGITKKLNYLKDLGVSRLWLTPIFQNHHVAVKKNRFLSNQKISSYHGYWIKDWFRLDPFLSGSDPDDLEVLDELIEAAYPVKIYLDTVLNHSSPRDATEESLELMARVDPVEDRAGNHIQRGLVRKNGQFFTSYGDDNADKKFFNHTPALSGSDWSDPQKVENYSLEGLADFNQHNLDFQNYMREAHNFWLTRFPKLAGYRIDTIKHVPNWYWKMFANDLYSKFPNVEIFGEYYGSHPYNTLSVDFFKSTRMSMFDFEFREAFVDVFLRDVSFDRIVDLWRKDYLYGDARNLITFLDSHDLPRMRGMGVSAPSMRQAIALWMVSRGVPCVYYGMEQDLFHPSDPGDPYNRPPMKNFDTRSPPFTFMQKLVKFRLSHDVLFEGQTHVVHLTKHILAFERLDQSSQKVFFALSRNPRDGSDSFVIKNLTLPDGIYLDILSEKTYQVNQGQISVNLKNGDIIILSTNHRNHSGV